MEGQTYIISVFALSLGGSVACLPLLIYGAKRNNLLDIPNFRSSHTQQVPRIGGVVFFLALMSSLFVARKEFDPGGLTAIGMGAMILFAVGLYDDLKFVKPMVKLLAQLIALFGLVYFYQDAIERFRIHSLFSGLSSGIFQVLVYGFFLVLINAINLMDGIDGLAVLISINFFAVMTFFFYPSYNGHFSIISMVLIGSMIAFLFFNLSNRYKVFMGDCGSLLLGFLMCGFSLQLMDSSCCDPALQQFSGNELVLLFVALFSLPVSDLFRVIFVRLVKRKPIFGADRNHLHHLVLDKLNGRPHIYTAMLLFVIHLILILLALFVMKCAL